MKKENFLKQFPKEQEYLASKLYNYYEIAQELHKIMKLLVLQKNFIHRIFGRN